MNRNRISAFLLSSLLLGQGFTTYAHAENSLNTTRTEIKQHYGISQSTFTSLSSTIQKELAKDNGEIVNIQESYFRLEQSSTGGGLILSKSIPTSDFKLTVVTQRVYDKAGKDTFKFITEGNWLTDPVWQLKDAIALAWSDEFTLYYHHCFIVTEHKTDADSCSVNKIVPEAGIAYEADLKIGPKERKIVLVAKVATNDSTGTANVVAEYAHETIGLSDISVGFSAGGNAVSISMSCSVGSILEHAEPTSSYFEY